MRNAGFALAITTILLIGGIQAALELVIGTRFERWQASRAYR